MPFIASLLAAAVLPLAAPSMPAASAAPTPMQAPAAPVGGEKAGSYNATDLDALRPLVGQTIEVTGTPSGTGKSKSGKVLYLNFAGAHKAVALVFFLKDSPAPGADPGTRTATSEDDLKPFVGKAISVKGKLADYKGDLQIVIDWLDQIKVTAP